MSERLGVVTIWEALHDHVFLASCSTAATDPVLEATPGNWRFRLTSSVGPFNVSAPMRVEIVEERPYELIVVRARGEDRKIGTRLTVDASVNISGSDSQVEVELIGSFEVLGKVANMGASIVRRQASGMITEFWDNFQRRVASRASTI